MLIKHKIESPMIVLKFMLSLIFLSFIVLSPE